MAHTRKKTVRRTELLEAARTVLAEKGFEAATISEIVARAGVAQGTFYLYFHSKFSIVVALAQEMQTQMVDAIRAVAYKATNSGEVIDASVHAAFTVLGQYQDVLPVIMTRMSTSEALLERENYLASYDSFIAKLIQEGQARGEMDSSIVPLIAAKLIVGLIYQSAYECYINTTKFTPEVYSAEAARFIRRALNVK